MYWVLHKLLPKKSLRARRSHEKRRAGAGSSSPVQHDQREPGQEAGRLGGFIIEFEPCQGVRCPKTAPPPAWRPIPQ